MKVFLKFQYLPLIGNSIKASNPDNKAKVRVFESANGWGAAPTYNENFLRPIQEAKFTDSDLGTSISR